MIRALYFLALLGAAAAACSDADHQGIQQCYAKWFAGYGFMIRDDFPAYWDFHVVRKTWLEQNGVNAQPLICKLGDALADCMAEYPCKSESVYASFGQNASDSNAYWLDLAVTTFQCKVAYNLMMKEFYCMEACRDNNQPALTKCETDVGKYLANGGDKCTGYNTLMACQSAVYSGCCDKAAAQIMCGTNRAGIVVTDPSPQCDASGKLNECTYAPYKLLDSLTRGSR